MAVFFWNEQPCDKEYRNPSAPCIYRHTHTYLHTCAGWSDVTSYIRATVWLPIRNASVARTQTQRKKNQIINVMWKENSGLYVSFSFFFALLLFGHPKVIKFIIIESAKQTATVTGNLMTIYSYYIYIAIAMQI